ncbi:MAG: DUF2382 domain-containing protein [Frankiaceae bacterium]
MLDVSHPDSLRGRTVVSSDGGKIGKVDEVYLDDQTSAPEWVAVSTGLFGSHVSLIPLATAEQRGEDIVVPYSKDQVKDAPHQDVDQHLSPAEEEQLFEYYGVSYGTGTTGTYGTDEVTAGTDAAFSGDRAGTVGHDTSGPTTDDAMTRSEERLHVGTEQVEAGRARLRKYVTTENVTQTVPVRKERVRLETEPITDANVGAAMDGPDISEEEHEVVLTEERPVVAKETVPVERVRLAKDEQVEEQSVSEQVRKEQIEADGVYPDDEVGTGRRTGQRSDRR